MSKEEQWMLRAVGAYWLRTQTGLCLLGIHFHLIISRHAMKGRPQPPYRLRLITLELGWPLLIS
jgi:hypothetical protein